LIDNKRDDQLIAGERHTLIDADLGVAITEFAKQRADRGGVIFEDPLACISAAVTEDGDDPEDVRLLGVKDRLDLVDGELIGALEPHLFKAEAAVEIDDIADLNIATGQV